MDPAFNEKMEGIVESEEWQKKLSVQDGEANYVEEVELEEGKKPDDTASIQSERNATFFSVLANMGMSCMGIGLLSLPGNFQKTGLVIGISALVVFAVATHVSLIFLCRLAGKLNLFSYGDLSHHYLGYWGVRATNWALVLQLLMVVIAFIRVPSDDLTNLFFAHQGELTGAPCVWTARTLSFLICVFICAVGFIYSLSKVSPISNFAFLCMSTAVVLFLIAFASSDEGKRRPYNWAPFDGDIKIALGGFGNMILAYTCQFNWLTCHREMKDRSRIETLAVVTIYGMALPLYLLMGIVGIFVMSKNGEDKVAKGSIFPHLGDEGIPIAARVLVVLMAISKTPLIFNALRDYFFQELNQIPALSGFSNKKLVNRIIVCVGLITPLYLISWELPFGPAVDMSGALLIGPTNFMLPALYIMKDASMYPATTSEDKCAIRRESKLMYILAFVLFLVGLFGFCCGTANTAIAIAEHNSTDPEPSNATCFYR